MASGSKRASMGHISAADFKAMVEGKTGSPSLATATSSSSTQSNTKNTLPGLQKRSGSDALSSLTSGDKVALKRTSEELKSIQEATNDWFRRLETLRQPFTLATVNSALVDATAMCEQLTSFSKETSWLEQEVSRVEAENEELEQQIQTLQVSIKETRGLLQSTLEIESAPASPISTTVMLLVVAISFIFIAILLVDSTLKGSHTYWRFS